MSNITDELKKYGYKEIKVIAKGNSGFVYKVENTETGKYYAIKEINKTQIHIVNEINKLKTLNIGNNLIKEIIETNQNLYIIMELYEYNLEDYIKKREDFISINEIREILIQLNSTFKIIYNEKMIHGDLKLNNILLSFYKIDKCSIKLSFYDSKQFIQPNLKNSTYSGSI